MLGSIILGMLPHYGHVGYGCNSFTELKIVNEPDAIINAAGVNLDVIQMIRINSLFPHLLAQAADKIPIIHLSTDRVFNGRSQDRYTVHSSTDAIDMFGRTKAIGEVRADHVHNVRMSFIGRGKGFVKDLTENYNDFKGLTNVRWSGSTVEAVALGIIYLLNELYRLPHVIHLATEESISRYEAAKLVLKAHNLEHVELTQHDSPTANYALLPTHIIPTLEEAIKKW